MTAIDCDGQLIKLTAADDGVEQNGRQSLEHQLIDGVVAQLGHAGDGHHQVEGGALRPFVDVAGVGVDPAHFQHLFRQKAQQLLPVAASSFILFSIKQTNHFYFIFKKYFFMI